MNLDKDAIMYKDPNKKFLEWFNSREGYHLLSERFYQEVEDGGASVAVRWLRAAFIAGARSQEISKTSPKPNARVTTDNG